MQKLMSFVTKYPKMIITVIIILTIPMTYFCYKAFLNLNADMLNYLPKSHPVVETFHEIGETFGGIDTILIGVEDDRGIYSKEVIEEIDRLTKEFEQLKISRETYRIALLRKIEKLTFNYEILSEIEEISGKNAISEEENKFVVEKLADIIIHIRNLDQDLESEIKFIKDNPDLFENIDTNLEELLAKIETGLESQYIKFSLLEQEIEEPVSMQDILTDYQELTDKLTIFYDTFSDLTDEQVDAILGDAVTLVMSLSNVTIATPSVTETGDKAIQFIDVAKDMLQNVPECNPEEDAACEPIDYEAIGREIEEKLISEEMYEGSVLSTDGKNTAILCRINQDASRTNEIVDSIEEILADSSLQKTHVAGALVTGSKAEMSALDDVSILIPFVILLVILVLLYSFRTIRGIILPLTTVLISVIWAIGFINLLGYELTIISIMLPVILVAIASAYGIHAINKYYEELAQIENPLSGKEVVSLGMSHVGLAIILAGVTTMIGFTSLSASDMPPIRQFGVFSAVGVFLAIIISIIFIPAFLAVLPVKKASGYFDPEKKPAKVTIVVKALDYVSDFIYKNYKIFLIIIAVLTAFFAFMIKDLKVESNDEAWFGDDSPVNQAYDFVRENFGGSSFFQILIEQDREQSIVESYDKDQISLTPATLWEMEYIQEYMVSNIDGVSNPLSVANIMKHTNSIFNDEPIIPSETGDINDIWEQIKDQDSIDQMIINEDAKALIQASIKSMDSEIITNVVNNFKRFLMEGIPGAEADPENEYHITLNLLRIFEDDIKESYPELWELLLKRQRDMTIFSIERYADINDHAKADEILKEIQINPDNVALNQYIKDVIQNKIELFFEYDFMGDYPELLESRVIIGQDLIDSIDYMFELDNELLKENISDLLINSENFEPTRQILVSELGDAPEETQNNYVIFKTTSAVDELSKIFIKAKKLNIALTARNRLIESGAITAFDMPEKFNGFDNTDPFLNEDENSPKYKLINEVYRINQKWFVTSPEELAMFDASNLITDDNQTSKIDINLNGMPVTFKIMDEFLFKNQLITLFTSLILVFIILAIQLRSLVQGLISLTPIVLTIIINFGIMALLDIRLDITTTMLSSIAIGIGIDYTIHFLSRFNRERKVEGYKLWHALRNTLETTGKAIVFNALTVAAGFAILGFSTMIPLKVFGLLIALTMVVSSIAALTVMPSLLLLIYHKKEK